MENDIKIVLDNGYLDIDTIGGFGVNISVDDIKNISSRNASYTKTIVLPGTKNNNTLLGNLFDINSTFTFFNPGAKTNCHIIVNSSVPIKGYLQLKNIKKLSNSDQQGNNIQYEVVIYDTTIDLLDRIGEKMLTDLDLSNWNHVWDYKSVCKSWGINTFTDANAAASYKPFTYLEGSEHTWNNCWTYPTMFKGDTKDGNIINDGQKDYELIDFYPAIFNKFYIYRIFAEAGISVGGDFWDTLSTFDNEIIPYNRETPQYNDAVILDNVLFQTGITADYVFADIVTTPSAGQWIDKSIFSNGSFLSPFQSIPTIDFDDDSTLPFFDQSTNWNNTNFGFTPIVNGYYDVSEVLVIKLEMFLVDELSNPVTGTRFTSNILNLNSSAVVRNTTTNTDVVGNINSIYQNISSPTTITSGYYSEIITLSGNILSDFILTGSDIVIPNLKLIGNTSTYRYGAFLDKRSIPEYKVTILKQHPDNANIKTRIFNSVKTGKLSSGEFATILEGNTIKMNAFIPQGIKQIDLINDLIKRYNLYVMKDPTNPNKLDLVTRDRFYELGASTTLDWTQKIDNNQEQKITLLQELQNKRVTFTYKNDGDDFNKAYTDATSDVYGIKKIEFDNFFAKGDKRVESIFSPTPLLPDYNGTLGINKIVPAINSQNPSNNIRILQWGGMKPTVNGRYFDFFFFDADKNVNKWLHMNTYAYAGHYDDPYAPTTDINFEVVPFVFYNQLEQITDNCLYNRYWRNYMNQISKGKMLTAQFNLDETDIHEIKDALNTRIWIKDSWFVINKIIDFDPTNKRTTEVELLKMNNPTPYIPILRPNIISVANDPVIHETPDGIGVFTGDPIWTLDEIEHGVKPIGFDYPVYEGGIIPDFSPIGFGDPITVKDFGVVDGGVDELIPNFNDFPYDTLDGGENAIEVKFTSAGAIAGENVFDGGDNIWAEAETVPLFIPVVKGKKLNSKVNSALRQ